MKKKRTILGHERIIWSAEIYKPVPILCLLQENGYGVKRRCNHRRTFIRDQIRLTNHHHVLEFLNHSLRLRILSKFKPLSIGSFEVQMQQIVIPRVIHRLKNSPETRTITFRARYHVSEPRQLGKPRPTLRTEIRLINCWFRIESWKISAWGRFDAA